MYDIRMGRTLVDVLAHPVTSVRCSSDGNALLASTTDGRIRMLDRSDGKLLKAFGGDDVSQVRVIAMPHIAKATFEFALYSRKRTPLSSAGVRQMTPAMAMVLHRRPYSPGMCSVEKWSRVFQPDQASRP